MSGYKHPCRYCGKLVEADFNVCPFCGKNTPTGPLRCPKCLSPVEEGWFACGHCGLRLEITCPGCGQETFFGSHCRHCSTELAYVDPGEKGKKKK